MEVPYSSYRLLTSDTGVYLFLNKEGQIIYVGKAINLKKRVSSYFINKNLGEKTKALVTQIDKIKTISTNSEVESFLLEEKLIKKYHPRYNISLKDAKTYPLIKISIKDKYPYVMIVRKKDNDKSLYFGPYTNVNSLRTVYKLIRKIFPFKSSQSHPKKLCLYYHLNLCPCPEVNENTNYKSTITHIVNFLNGNTKKVVSDLQKERDMYSKNEEYEKALEIQRKLDSIKLITSSFYKPFEYENNPNFKSDVLKEELKSLREVLIKNNTKVKKLERIECYDISNTQGTNSTASMVVLINGATAPSEYKRFKIKGDYNNKPNDFEMLKEVLKRRFNHKDWKSPDLIVVDGGKGQVSSAQNALNEINITIPLIGIAKREEILINSQLSEIKLPMESKALNLIIKIRNEAHRFAITYHKKLRSKLMYD